MPMPMQTQQQPEIEKTQVIPTLQAPTTMLQTLTDKTKKEATKLMETTKKLF
jgi:hypothetical protein